MNTLTELVVIAPPRSDVLPLESTLNTTPGTVSANSRKLRVNCGIVSICCSDTVFAISDVLTSTRRAALTVMSSSEPVAPALPAVGVRSRVAVEATVRVTAVSVPMPASTL